MADSLDSEATVDCQMIPIFFNVGLFKENADKHMTRVIMLDTEEQIADV